MLKLVCRAPEGSYKVSGAPERQLSAVATGHSCLEGTASVGRREGGPWMILNPESAPDERWPLVSGEVQDDWQG